MMLILRVPGESSSPPPPYCSSPRAVLFVNLPEIMSRAGSTVNTALPYCSTTGGSREIGVAKEGLMERGGG
jgi:hypothetical protein